MGVEALQGKSPTIVPAASSGRIRNTVTNASLSLFTLV